MQQEIVSGERRARECAEIAEFEGQSTAVAIVESRILAIQSANKPIQHLPPASNSASEILSGGDGGKGRLFVYKQSETSHQPHSSWDPYCSYLQQ